MFINDIFLVVTLVTVGTTLCFSGFECTHSQKTDWVQWVQTLSERREL